MDPTALASHWIDCWNRRDLQGVLTHFAEDAVFTSPRALLVTGSAEVRGRAALQAYWSAALERTTELVFELEDVAFDPLRRVLTIAYRSRREGVVTRAIECLRLGPDDRATHGSAYYGAIVEPR